MVNTFKTVFFLTILMLLFGFIGMMIGGKSGMLIAIGLAGVMNFITYWFSDKIVLKMYGAQEIQPGDNPRLYNIVQMLSSKAGLPMPRVYIIPTDTANAFATGRDPEHGAVAVTQGIMARLSDDEMEGVIAHELGHIRNRDILISTIVATIAGAISSLASMAQWAAMFGGFGNRSDDNEDRGGNIVTLIVLAIVAPLAAMMIQLAISRSREFLADQAGAEISGKPSGLASALIKLEQSNLQIPLQTNNATAHMFIVSPLSGSGFVGLFRTHPSTEERVEKLRSYSQNQLGYNF